MSLGSYKFAGGILLAVVLVLVTWSIAVGATNIDSARRYAWNEGVGWIDFYGSNTVNVFSTRLEGYATSTTGQLALNCNSTPNGNTCAGPSGNWKVSNDGNGNLSGWAWDDGIGWVSFCGGAGTADCPGTISYQVSINSSSGIFSGWAWSEAVGWIGFNCAGPPNSCGTSDYYVKTSWFVAAAEGILFSSVYDTGSTGGVAPNAVLWQGTQPSGTGVKFHFASSNCANGKTNPPTCTTGDWTYLGPDGTTATYYLPAGPNIPAMLNLAYHNNQRYFRYKVVVSSNAAQTQTPTVEDVILNWSR